MRALTIQQPWLWAILHAGKDVENRNWRPRENPGRIALHAGGRLDQDALHNGADSTRWYLRRPDGQEIRVPFNLIRGFLVATADVRIVTQSDSPWFTGPIGWELHNIRVLREPIPCRGALSLWRVPDRLEKRMAETGHRRR